MLKQMMQQIVDEDLVNLCLRYCSLLHPTTQFEDDEPNPKDQEHPAPLPSLSSYPSLGQLLRMTNSSLFLEVLLRLRGTKFPVATSIELIRCDVKAFREFTSQIDFDSKLLFQSYMEWYVEIILPLSLFGKILTFQ